MQNKEVILPQNEKEAIQFGKRLMKRSTNKLNELDEQWRSNINVMLELIKYREDAYEYASIAIREDRELAKYVLSKCPKMFKFIEGGLNSDIELIDIALKNSSNGNFVFKYISEELKNNKLFMLKYISKYPMALEFVSDSLKNDDLIVKTATQKNANALKYASMKFRDDKEFVFELMSKNKTYKDDFGNERKDTSPLYIIRYASNRLRSEPEIVNKLIKQDIFTYRCFSKKVKANKKFALRILKQQGILLDSVDESLKADKEVVLTAVKSYGYALEYASEELKADREVVLAAIKKDGRALTYASEELRRDIKLINIAFKQCGPFIIDPVAFKVYQRLDMKSGLSESVKSEIEKEVTQKLILRKKQDVKEILDKLKQKKEKIKTQNLTPTEEGKLIENLNLEYQAALKKIDKEYKNRTEREIERLEQEKIDEKIQTNDSYRKLKKYNNGTMTPTEVLNLQDWLLKRANGEDFVKDLDDFSVNSNNEE